MLSKHGSAISSCSTAAKLFIKVDNRFSAAICKRYASNMHSFLKLAPACTALIFCVYSLASSSMRDAMWLTSGLADNHAQPTVRKANS